MLRYVILDCLPGLILVWTGSALMTIGVMS